MRTELKIQKLEGLLNRADSLDGLYSGDIDFLEWKEALEVAYIQIFGENSTQYRGLKSRIFSVFHIGNNVPNLREKHAANYKRDMRLTVNALAESLQDLRDELKYTSASVPAPIKPKSEKVFISHAGLDVAIVTELILLLRALGLQNEQIFCTSVPGYKIPLGTKNYLDAIKSEILGGAVVIFLLSKNFYNSPMCIAEMGATWVLDSYMIPMVIPPFSFKNVEGVIPFTQGMLVNDKYEIHALAKALGEKFGFSVKPNAVWESDRDRILTAINAQIAAAAIDSSAKDMSRSSTPAIL